MFNTDSCKKAFQTSQSQNKDSDLDTFFTPSLVDLIPEFIGSINHVSKLGFAPSINILLTK